MKIKTSRRAGTSVHNKDTIDVGCAHLRRHLATVLLLLVLLSKFGSVRQAYAGPSTTLVTVRNHLSFPVGGAMVYRCCSWQGNTDANGQITLSRVSPGEHLQVRKLVYIGSTNKAAHNGWSYHVWQTNIVQQDDGSQSDHVITNPAKPQTVVISPYNAQIGFNLVVSVQYNATSDQLDEIAQALVNGSEFLFDASDGQMFFENAVIYEDQVNWDHADIRYVPQVRPNASIGPDGARATIADSTQHINMTSGLVPTGHFHTLVHEWGHYGVGAYDEYSSINLLGDFHENGYCSIDDPLLPESVRASIMEGEGTEFCHDGNHGMPNSHQQQLAQSVWATLSANWNGHGAHLRTPMSRGTANPGPTSLPCFSRLSPIVMHGPFAACPAIQLTVLTPGSPSGVGMTARKLDVILSHGNRSIIQGQVGPGKTIKVYGAMPGDLIYVSKSEGVINGDHYTTSGEATVSSCGPLPITTETWKSGSAMPMPWLDGDTNEFAVFLDTRGAQPAVRATMDQDGQKRQEVELTYDERRGGYIGRCPIRRDVAPNFTLDLETSNERGVIARTSYRYTAARFQSRPNPFWELFPPHYPVNLVGRARLLPEGKAVLAGTTSLPAAPPSGLVVVGGPYSVQVGEDATPLTNPTGWTFLYEEDPAVKIDPKSVSVYRYEQGRWLPLQTTVNLEHGEVYTSSDQWGVYAVFAQLVQ
jgi:hypothetical protein